MRLRAAALAILLCAPARAAVLSEDPFAGKSFELGATVRSFAMLLGGGPLNGTAALSLSDVRARLDWRANEWFRLVIHDELALLVGSEPLDAGAGPLGLGQGRRAPLWAPLDWTLTSSPRLALTDRIDWLWARFSRGPVQLSIGRQPVTVGTGVIWTPIDLLAPFSPLQIDTEFKPGVDALRIDVRLPLRMQLTLLGVVGRGAGPDGFHVDAAGSAALARLELSLEKMHLGAIAGYVRQDVVVGVDGMRDFGGADAHFAATVTYVPEQERRVRGQAMFVRAVAGLTVAPGHDVHATLEVYYNGSGAEDPSEYSFDDPRFQVGEVYNVGRLYSGLVMDWAAHPLIHLGAAVLANLRDPSLVFAPQLRYELAANTLLIAGAYVPAGSAGSEYGFYPYFFHVDLKAYF